MSTLALWLLTYLLHSTVLLGAAALVRFLLRERRLAVQEAVLRAALVGAFVTASLQLGLGLRPLGGALAVPVERPSPVADRAIAAPAAAPAAEVARHVTLTRAEVATSVQVASLGPARRWVSSVVAGQVPWQSILAAAWVGSALLALSRLAVAAVRLRRLLRERRPLGDRDLGSQAQAVGEALGLRGVRLSTARRLAVPLATGLLRPEVCLPTRALEELAPEERIALCAHELAHVARRDPAWLLLARLIEALAPLQPLNLWGRRRLQDLSECLSDDLAVAASGRPLGLARSLVDVASWALVGTPVQPALASGALSARSRLGHRVERLMDPVRSLERPRRLLLPLAAAAVVATALLTPVVSGTAGQPPEKPTAPPAPQATPAKPAPPAAPQPTAEPSVEGGVAGGVQGGVQGGVKGGVAGGLPDARQHSSAERELERLAERISARSRLHEAEMAQLHAEIEALTAKMQPQHEAIERLSRELEQAVAKAVVAEHDEGKDLASDSEKATAARRRLAELQEQIHEAARGVRPPESEVRALGEKARALAELSRPSSDEIRDLHRLAEQLARESTADAQEIARITREATEHIREEMSRLREEMHRVREEVRRAAQEARKAAEERHRAEERPAPPDKPERP